MNKSNYEIFKGTVQSLKNSQGFYSRLDRQLKEMNSVAHEELRNTLNNLPQWSSTVDCVLYLEQ